MAATKLGEYRHKVWADEPIESEDTESLEPVVEFVPRSRMSCKIDPTTGDEALRSNQVLPSMHTIITVQWSSFAAAITARWRLRFVRNGTDITYNIESIVEKFMNGREIEFTCNSGLNRG